MLSHGGLRFQDLLMWTYASYVDLSDGGDRWCGWRLTHRDSASPRIAFLVCQLVCSEPHISTVL